MPNPLPEYDRPPLDELVIGVQFKPLQALRAAHLGLYWSRIRDRYPWTEDQPAVAHVLEREEIAPQQGGMRPIEVLPFIQRCWFLDKSKNELIQVQKDRFLRNWRKQTATDSYPRFPYLVDEFRREWEGFLAFLKDEGVGKPEVNQCELSYINNIEPGVGWQGYSDLPKVLNLLREPDSPGFLPPPEVFSWDVRYKLPDGRGRLRVQVQPAFRGRDMKLILLFNLTARGAPAEDTPDHLWGWFHLAHEWIVRAFDELTVPAMHELWGKKR